MIDVNGLDTFLDTDELPINNDVLIKELEFRFNSWFSNLLTETKQNEAGVYYTEANTLEDVAECISDDDLEFMCYFAYWERDFVINDDKRNAVYWYAIHLLYSRKGNVIEDGKCSCGCDGKLFDYDGLFIFLDSLTPVKS